MWWSFKVKVLLIFTILKILKIYYDYFWLDFLNKCTIVYLEIRFSKNSYHIETSQLICRASPLAKAPEVSRLPIRSSSITRSGERPAQKRQLLRITCSPFMKCLYKPGLVMQIWEIVWRCKYTNFTQRCKVYQFHAAHIKMELPISSATAS